MLRTVLSLVGSGSFYNQCCIRYLVWSAPYLFWPDPEKKDRIRPCISKQACMINVSVIFRQRIFFFLEEKEQQLIIFLFCLKIFSRRFEKLTPPCFSRIDGTLLRLISFCFPPCATPPPPVYTNASQTYRKFCISSSKDNCCNAVH